MGYSKLSLELCSGLPCRVYSHLYLYTISSISTTDQDNMITEDELLKEHMSDTEVLLQN